jgi:hypothetical protein
VAFGMGLPGAGISNNCCATNSGSPEVEQGSYCSNPILNRVA